MTLKVILNMIAWLLLIIPAQVDMSVDFLFPTIIIQSGWRNIEADNSVTFRAKLYILFS